MIDFAFVRDLWYFLYSSTDREFREAHLEDMLRIYYQKISKYWGMENFQMDFNSFVDEINQYKGSCVAYLSIFIMYIMLNPNVIPLMESWSEYRRFLKAYREDVATMASEDDHPNMKEFKRRCTEILIELYDKNHI